VQEFAHTVADGNVATLALGLEAPIEGTDCRVVADSGSSRVPQVMTDQVVAFAAHMERAWTQRLAMLVDAGAILFGKDAEVTDELVRCVETVDVCDLGDENGGGGITDARDGNHLHVG